MGTERIYLLLEKYRDNLASAEEVSELFRLMQSPEGRAAAKELMAEDWMKGAGDAVEGKVDWDRMWVAIQSATRKPRRG